MPEGNPAPPRPLKPEALISEMIYFGCQLLSFTVANLSNIPNHDLLREYPSFYANHHIFSHSQDPLRDAHISFGRFYLDLLIRPIVSSLVEVVYLRLWQVL